MALSAEERLRLLRLYNPLLVLLPRGSGYRRPGAWWRWPNRQRGDYHPCSVEAFLSLVVRRDAPRPWRLKPDLQEEPLATLEGLAKALLGAGDGVAAGWELDVRSIASGKASRAWVAYCAMLDVLPALGEPKTYARCIETPGGAVLQYWYLYVYNDAANIHEGEWEMVSFELERDGETFKPVRAGYSAHEHGHQRPWPKLRFRGERPLVYVARGSHAAYFEPKAGGYKPLKIAWPKNLEGVAKVALYAFNVLGERFPLLGSSFPGVFGVLGIRDRPGRLPEDAEPGEPAVVVDPDVIELAEPVPPEQWWRALDCPWGSSHPRVSGFVAPPPPWKQTGKWEHPLAWIDGLEAG